MKEKLKEPKKKRFSILFTNPIAGALLLILVGVFILSATLLTQGSMNGTAKDSARFETQCTENGGTWIKEHNECEDIDKKTCEVLGGNYNACASACRHQSSNGMCIQVCVQVCKLQ